MKKYKVSFEMKLFDQDKASDWNAKPELSAEVGIPTSELVPPGRDPVQYLRERLSEEVRRHSAHLSLDWKDEENPGEEI